MIKRIMWLLNHSSARRFEVPMLKQVGIEEVFLPKNFPITPNFRSASIDYSEDNYLTIPKDELAILNAQDWYTEPSVEAWEIANRYFPALFFILFEPNLLKSIAKHYKGIAVLRAYGLDKSLTYSRILKMYGCTKYAQMMGERLVFGEAYSHLHQIEESTIKDKRLFLPLGMSNCDIVDNWTGINKRIFFVCPDAGFNHYYTNIYRSFVEQFGDFPYVIGGSQPVALPDPNVLGFVSKEVHEQNMREMRVMYYHSSEPNHIHYHPFEAIRVGMPLIFMAGGILDRFGGENMPGRCTSIKEARRKIKRVLNDDWELINAIRSSQPRLLEPMKGEHCVDDWVQALNHITELSQHKRAPIKKTSHKLAFFVDEKNSTNFLRAELLAKAIEHSANQKGEQVELVIAYVKDTETINPIKRNSSTIYYRNFKWKSLSQEEGYRALVYAGHERELNELVYYVPDDGINHFLDCDLWLFSDEVKPPILPIRPYTLISYDFIEKGNSINILSEELLKAAADAECVIATSKDLYEHLLQIAGLPKNKLIELPLLSIADTVPPHICSKNKPSIEVTQSYWEVIEKCL